MDLLFKNHSVSSSYRPKYGYRLTKALPSRIAISPTLGTWFIAHPAVADHSFEICPGPNQLSETKNGYNVGSLVCDNNGPCIGKPLSI